MSAFIEMTNFAEIPLIALSPDTKFLFSCLMNPPKVIPSCSGLPRDWRGLADLFNLSGEIIPSISNHVDPTQHIFDIVIRKNSKITINDLQIILEKIERWDVIDDTKELLEKDARDYEERMARSRSQIDVVDNDIDNQMLTIDDLYRIKAGLTIQSYDAFMLCADEDSTFAEEIIENLEQKHNLKLCVKDRDLISGASFEHEAVMQLISDRCNRLLVVLSPNFLNSPANKFFLTYAQAIGIDKRQRKVIPCYYKKCTPPPQLMYTFILDYNKSSYYDFWGRLRDSIKYINTEMAQTITTLNDEVPKNKAGSAMPDFSDIPKEQVEPTELVDVTGKLMKPSKTFPWNSKKITVKQSTRLENNGSLLDDDVQFLNFPSLDGVDELESSSLDETIKKGKKKTVMKVCAMKIKSLVTKS